MVYEGPSLDLTKFPGLKFWYDPSYTPGLTLSASNDGAYEHMVDGFVDRAQGFNFVRGAVNGAEIYLDRQKSVQSHKYNVAFFYSSTIALSDFNFLHNGGDYTLLVAVYVEPDEVNPLIIRGTASQYLFTNGRSSTTNVGIELRLYGGNLWRMYTFIGNGTLKRVSADAVMAANNWEILRIQVSGTEYSMRAIRTGQLDTTTHISTTADCTNPMNIGGGGGLDINNFATFRHNIGDIIAFDRVLDDVESNIIYDYLFSKWHI